MTRTVLEAQDLKKSFVIDRSLREQIFAPFSHKRNIFALDQVGFSLRSGEILAVVGPNGAGKTTLLRILANLLDADGGRVSLLGEELNHQCRLRANIGYVSSDERSFFWRLSGRQNLEFFARLYGVPPRAVRGRIAGLLELFALEDKAGQLFRDYSAGTRKKFALMRALVHQPRILLLDEVTNSLDAPSARQVKSLVRQYVSGGQGCAAVWSTHRFEEVGEICDSVLAIDKGCVRFSGAVADLKDNAGAKSGCAGDGTGNEAIARSIYAVFADSS